MSDCGDDIVDDLDPEIGNVKYKKKKDAPKNLYLGRVEVTRRTERDEFRENNDFAMAICQFFVTACSLLGAFFLAPYDSDISVIFGAGILFGLNAFIGQQIFERNRDESERNKWTSYLWLAIYQICEMLLLWKIFGILFDAPEEAILSGTGIGIGFGVILVVFQKKVKKLAIWPLLVFVIMASPTLVVVYFLPNEITIGLAAGCTLAAAFAVKTHNCICPPRWETFNVG